MNDEELERLLGAALRREADRVVPSDRFDEVLDRVRDTPPRRSGWLVGVAAAAVVAVGLGAAWVLTPDRTTPAPMAPPTTASASTVPAPTPTTPTPPSACSTTEEYRALPAYYVSTATKVGALKLERLVLDRPACGSRTETAILASMADPGTPGMATWWNPVDHVTVTSQGTKLVVDIPGAAFRDELTPPQASWAIEQITWAALGAWGSADSVVYRRDGKADLGPSFSFGGAELERGRDQTVQARTWFDLPQGSRLAANTQTALTGQAVLRPVSYEVRDTSGKTVASGQAAFGGTLQGQGASSFTISVSLKPGSYTVLAWVKGEPPQPLEVTVG